MHLRARVLAAVTGGALLAGGLLATPTTAGAVTGPARAATSTEVRFDAADQGIQLVPDGPSPMCGTNGQALRIPIEVSGLTGTVGNGGVDDINVRATLSTPFLVDLSARLIAPSAAASTDLVDFPCTASGLDGYSHKLDGTYTFSDGAATTLQPTADAGSNALVAPGSYRANSAGDPAAPVDITSAFDGVSDLNGTWYLELSDQYGDFQTSISAVSLGFGTVDVDTTGPATTITSGPEEGASVDAAPSFSFSSADTDVARFECAVTSGPDPVFSTCTSPFQTDVTPGTYKFLVRAVDTSGNTGDVAARKFTLNDVACDQATEALQEAQTALTQAKAKTAKAKEKLRKARASGNQVRIDKAKKKLAQAKAAQADAVDAVADAQAQVDQDC